jgi:methylphosphotriester-DNA--protein-cysteine methyltransferase
MAERNRVFFKSVAEAEAAGYKRAGNCPAEVQAVISRPSSGATQVKPAPIPTQPSSSRPVVEPIKLAPKIGISTGKNTSNSQEPIIGNKNSKIYHVPGCSSYHSVSEKNRMLFNTAEEAEKAGFRKAKTCS